LAPAFGSAASRRIKRKGLIFRPDPAGVTFSCMKRDAAVSILSGCAAELRDKFGVTELCLFGSVARDEARDTSDVDVLVSFAVSPSFTAFMDLKHELEQRLGARVDLVTRAGLKPRLRPHVEREALRVA
jgi:predicted nucleotidyltransferase